MDSEILIYKNPDGNIKIDVRLEDETVWLTQDQMAALFGKAKSTINEHIKNVFYEGELDEKFRIWATQRLREYIIKGFTLNDDRFKSGSSMNYFNELQERYREMNFNKEKLAG